MKESVYGGWFSFLPKVKGFLLDTVYPERAVCRACGKITEGGVLCKECQSRLGADGTLFAWDREDLEDIYLSLNLLTSGQASVGIRGWDTEVHTVTL